MGIVNGAEGGFETLLELPSNFVICHLFTNIKLFPLLRPQ